LQNLQLHAAGCRGTAVSEVDSLMLARLRGIAGAMMVLSRETTTGEASDRRVRPRYLLWLRIGAGLRRGCVCCGRGWKAPAPRFIVVASVVLCLAVAEAYALIVSAPAIEIRTPGFSLPHPVLGRGPGHPGVFHDRSLDGKTGSVIYDVDYTIDQHRNRQVISAPTGTSVAFFGDSMTFGQGVRMPRHCRRPLRTPPDIGCTSLNLAFPAMGRSNFCERSKPTCSGIC
jgi:hypothetical protein